MRTTLDPEDIAAIGDYVIEKLQPLLSGNGKAEPDTIMTIEETAIFLNLYNKKNKKPNIAQIYQWVNNSQHGLSDFPYMKAGKLLRFSKRSLIEWMKKR